MTPALPQFECATFQGRRAKRRYTVVAPVQYTLTPNCTSREIGHGRTVNISGNSVLFQCEESLAIGTQIQLRIAWPVNLDQNVGLSLWVAGHVIRIQDDCVAVRFGSYEFRTRRV